MKTARRRKKIMAKLRRNALKMIPEKSVAAGIKAGIHLTGKAVSKSVKAKNGAVKFIKTGDVYKNSVSDVKSAVETIRKQREG